MSATMNSATFTPAWAIVVIELFPNTSTKVISMGDIVIELFPNQAPKTVANFVELATGAKEWVDSRRNFK